MALQGPIPVQFGAVFPDGAYAAGSFEMVRDYDRSTPDRAVQQADKDSGLPLWAVEVIDAQVQPVLPPPSPGSPFTAVEFDGMTATPYVDSARCQGNGKCGARVAYSFKATGGRAPSRGIGRPAEHKDAA